MPAVGIIPARAGFTLLASLAPRPQGDHPRSRGVYFCVIPLTLDTHGSSPLARGLPARLGLPGAGRGIIPARAGFTLHRISQPPGRRDHPRSRGVYGSGSAHHALGAGSSPLARGLPVLGEPHRDQHRIIPARAGFTSSSTSTVPAYWDHPRSRGVYGYVWEADGGVLGSSPLARGLQPIS